MNQTKKLVYTALFTALCCVGTMVIQIPTPPVSAPPLPTFSPAMLTMLPRLLLSNS